MEIVFGVLEKNEYKQSKRWGEWQKLEDGESKNTSEKG
jgi:hypothetical protein